MHGITQMSRAKPKAGRSSTESLHTGQSHYGLWPKEFIFSCHRMSDNMRPFSSISQTFCFPFESTETQLFEGGWGQTAAQTFLWRKGPNPTNLLHWDAVQFQCQDTDLVIVASSYNLARESCLAAQQHFVFMIYMLLDTANHDVAVWELLAISTELACCRSFSST